MTKHEYFFRVTEVTEATNALKMLVRFLSEKEPDSYNLKWALLTTHNALQAFMVLVLRGSSNLDIIEFKKEYAGANAQEICFDPNPKMLSFDDLFHKCKETKHMLGNPFIDKSGTITANIRNLNCARTNFVHYLPKAWSIGIEGLLLVIKDALKVIEFLIDHQRITVYYCSDEQKVDLKKLVTTANELIETY